MRIEYSIVIKRPVEEVFAFLNDTKKLPQWNTAMLEARQTSEGSVGEGTTFWIRSQFLGRQFESTSAVTAYQSNRHVVYTTTSGPIPLEARYALEPIDDGTRVTEILEGEPGGFFRLAEPVLRRMAQRQVESSLDNLKDLLEAQA